ncbi:MAG: beta-ketoacyl-ACP synthase II [Lentisphaeria bacterium]|jgi:3-oxoacyl-[acyl-carrier-protein] synthase II|nr:beta-ketoacyl-ACP synthase II [Lentisphaeria bacterium]MDY0176767.1 beta-ketoacyl-ACP synthase II [Lentisphaeria bacterium]NLZ60217.1 beta-ketoacyl-ACP synthase II [Lentisphaerota bacterium]
MNTWRRVVVTGMGVVSPVGNSVESAWEALLAGKSGIGRISRFDVSEFRSQIAGEVKDFDIGAYLEPKEAARLDLYCHYAAAAAHEAMTQARLLHMAELDRERAGVLVASGIGGIATTCTQQGILSERGPGRVSPMTIPMLIADMGAGFLAIKHGFKGPNFGLNSACASALHAIGEAAWVIRRNDADIMLCGGSEAALIPLSIAAFSSMRALSTRNEEPELASRPFDAQRDGFVFAEGAGLLVLEELEHALARGASPLAEVAGYGASCDAYHVTAPASDGSGAARAIREALRTAQMQPEHIDYINAHGTSTPMNDAVETRAIKLALGEKAYNCPVSSTKSQTGHMLGAAGGFESMVCIKSILSGIIPGTMNYQTPDPDCDLDYVPNRQRKATVNNALKINLGFGGHNAAVLYKKYEPAEGAS